MEGEGRKRQVKGRPDPDRQTDKQQIENSSGGGEGEDDLKENEWENARGHAIHSLPSAVHNLGMRRTTNHQQVVFS